MKDVFALIGYHLINTYWTITLCCLALYACEAFVNIMADKEAREAATNYRPRITYGHILSYFIGSFIPLLNMWMVLYSLCPSLWNVIKNFFKLLDRPIVIPK